MKWIRRTDEQTGKVRETCSQGTLKVILTLPNGEPEDLWYVKLLIKEKVEYANTFWIRGEDDSIAESVDDLEQAREKALRLIEDHIQKKKRYWEQLEKDLKTVREEER